MTFAALYLGPKTKNWCKQTLLPLFYFQTLIEISSGQKPCNIAETVENDDDRQLVRLILEKYKDHPSVHAIREGNDSSNSFSFHEVQHHEVWNLLRSLDEKKSTGED